MSICVLYSSVINTKPIQPKQKEDISFVNDDVVDDIEESLETTTDSTDQLEPIEMSLSSEFKPTIRPSRVISEEETVTSVGETGGESVTDDEEIVTKAEMMNTVQSSLNTENAEDTVHIHTAATHSNWIEETQNPISSFTHSGSAQPLGVSVRSSLIRKVSSNNYIVHPSSRTSSNENSGQFRVGKLDIMHFYWQRMK